MLGTLIMLVVVYGFWIAAAVALPFMILYVVRLSRRVSRAEERLLALESRRARRVAVREASVASPSAARADARAEGTAASAPARAAGGRGRESAPAGAPAAGVGDAARAGGPAGGVGEAAGALAEMGGVEQAATGGVPVSRSRIIGADAARTRVRERSRDAAARPSGGALAAAPSRARGRGPDLPSLEQVIGLRIYNWLGALALFLAGAFLVKYGVDQGWITPPVRVSLALVFGTALVIAAEWLRPNAERACAALSAAGIGVIIAGLYAGTSVYELISPAAGFGMLALTSLTAVGLSLRHGVIVGVVGLVAGLLTPGLVDPGGRAGVAFLTLYILILHAAVLAASRRREWWPVAATSLVGSLFWGRALIAGAADAQLWGGTLAVASALGYIVFAPKPRRVPEILEVRTRAVLEAAAVIGATWVVGSIVVPHGALEWPWVFFAVLGAAGLALGRSRPQRELLGWIAAAGTALALLEWTSGPTTGGFSSASALVIVGALGALYALGAFAVMWDSARPWRWAALSGASAVVYFLVALAPTLAQGELGGADTTPWGAAAVALAAIATCGLALYAYRASRAPDLNATVGALGAAATAFIALAVPLAAGRDLFAVAWSLQTAALVWLGYRTGFASLRRLAWPLAALVTFELLLNPGLTEEVGALPVLNWLLFAFGVPTVAFAVAALYAHRAADKTLSTALQWAALTFGLVMIALQIEHAFSETALSSWSLAPFVSASTYGIAIMLYALALRWAWRRWPLDSLRAGGLLSIALALAVIVVVSGVLANPWLVHVAVGSMPVVNWLLYGYALAAILAYVAAKALASDDSGERAVAKAAMCASIVLVLLWVTLLVRQAFHGSFLDVGVLSTAENYAYSLAWVLLGSALLVIGIETRSLLARWASLLIMLLAVSKVFLYDVAAIGDLFRVLSFLGLGLSLVGLAWVYQRFVFDRGNS